MIDGNPANRQNWRLVCSACAGRFELDETIDLVAGHWQQDHGDVGGAPQFTMLWVGKGPAPKKGFARSFGPRSRRRR